MVLGILLARLAICTFLQSRTRPTLNVTGGRRTQEQSDLTSVPVVSGANGPRPKLANTGKQVVFSLYSFTGLAGNETTKVHAIENLRKYGVDSCGPPGFYGTIGVQMDLERDIADFLGTEASILYSQGFSTILCVISVFAKRGDITVTDRSIIFDVQRGLQISRSTVRRFDHKDLKSLEERRNRRGPLTRRFFVTGGTFERDAAMVDLPKLIELKHKYRCRLILDESISFGTVGRTRRGFTELYNVPATQIDMIVGSVANGLNLSGGFCASSRIVVDHQRINGTSFVFSAAIPAPLAISASEGINIPRNTPLIPSTMQLKKRVWITRARRLRGQELVEARPSIRLAITVALLRKECERAANVIKAAIVKVLTKHK
ncbi:serine palmitoyltransferase [Lactarius indigo]|nr:serine palmitoyltransferase [Lactarius indigo]